MLNGLCCRPSTIDIYFIDKTFRFHLLYSLNKPGFSPDKIAITDFGLFLAANNSTGGSLIKFYIFHFYSYFYL